MVEFRLEDDGPTPETSDEEDLILVQRSIFTVKRFTFGSQAQPIVAACQLAENRENGIRWPEPGSVQAV